jgi:protein translocase SEC61 complex gamma subunit
MKVATKPDRTEIWLVLRVTAIGMGALGFLGFMIKLASEVIFVANTGNTGTFINSFMNLMLPLVK